MRLHLIDWLIVGLYAAFAVGVGLWMAKRAGRDVDQYFLSGRTLPWWMAGTSMVATTFAADTPLVIGGWVRDHGIWKNWLWWCFAVGGTLTAFLFARYWRRAGVMTQAELAEMRYGGSGAAALRGFLGFYHAGVGNTLVLCWVLLAASKIVHVLLGIDPIYGLVAACALAMGYSLAAGFWGVVVTDAVQFVMAMVGSIALAIVSWRAVGGMPGVRESVERGGIADRLDLMPPLDGGMLADPSTWSIAFAAVLVYLGVAWWTVDAVDGGGLVIQRIAACKDERHGALSVLWYNVAHNALRPWPWIMVALASLVVLPDITVEAGSAGRVVEFTPKGIVVEYDDQGAGRPRSVELALEGAEDWRPMPSVDVGDRVAEGDVVARTDSERAYVVMLGRYLPVGLLGLVTASLMAAFMSTIDTHVNLAASFFVNDVYRRFIRPQASPTHYVTAARAASVVVMIVGAILAAQADSIGSLFLFFTAFLGGVGPVYVMRWVWWRVTAATEIAAMVTSSVVVTGVTLAGESIRWGLGPLSPDGILAPEGRLCVVAACSLVVSTVVVFLGRPRPEDLVDFYRCVRPIGFWGPVGGLAPDVEPSPGAGTVLAGCVGGLALTWGLMLAIGSWVLDRPVQGVVTALVAVAGGVVAAWSLRRSDRAT